MTVFDHPADAVIAAALASGASHARAGEAAGCSPATVKRRLAEPAFRAHVEELRSDHVGRVEQRLGRLSGRALDALEALLADADAPAQRLGAARAVLSGLLDYTAAGEVERRLAELEARLAAPTAGRVSA
jgi:hypothetical protein